MFFADIYKTFEKYNVSEAGTFFRFPLRNKDTSKISEISSKCVSQKQMTEIFNNFKNDMHEVLLFVNSVQEVSLEEVLEIKSEKIPDSIQTVTKHTVTMHLSDDSKQKRADFQNYVNEMALLLNDKQISLTEISVKEVCFEAVIKDNDGNEETWQIAQRFGFQDPSQISPSVISAFEKGDLGLLPKGGVAYLKKINGKDIKKMNEKDIKRANRLFCFLPLPVPTKLPVHINGHFALDHETRRGLWNAESNTDSYKKDWNKCLMEGVIAPVYCTLLCLMRDEVQQFGKSENYNDRMSKYFSLFPRIVSDEVPYVNDMVKAVYKYIGTENLHVLPIKGNDFMWMGPTGETDHKIFLIIWDHKYQAL